MIGAMIDHMEKHLPYHEVFVFFWFLYRFIKQHIVPQFCQIVAHAFLNAVPVGANNFSIVNISRRNRF